MALATLSLNYRQSLLSDMWTEFLKKHIKIPLDPRGAVAEPLRVLARGPDPLGEHRVPDGEPASLIETDDCVMPDARLDRSLSVKLLSR
jgi:hypothetical protein